MSEKLAELARSVRHLDMLHQYAIKVAERDCPGFTKSLENLTKKVETLQKEITP